MAGGKPHASNPRDVHQAKERHDVLRRQEAAQAKRARRCQPLAEADLIPLLRSCCHDIPMTDVDLTVLAYRLAHSPLRMHRP